MQIGAGKTSRTLSYTPVTYNLFKVQNDEVGIISSKSNFNTFF